MNTDAQLQASYDRFAPNAIANPYPLYEKLRQEEPQMNGALNLGCNRTEVIEVIMQMLIYAGFPAALSGIAIAKEVFKARDKRGQTDQH